LSRPCGLDTILIIALSDKIGQFIFSISSSKFLSSVDFSTNYPAIYLL
jgi:hypothetical protein